MFGKILLTAAVIAAAVLMLRLRTQRRAPEPEAAPRPRQRLVRWLAAAVVAVMLAAAVLMLYLEWRAGAEVVEVRVIDGRSGQVATYRALRGDIDERSFRTTDGRRVVLAETERLEMSGR
jgi:hypothetical protein